MAGTIPAGRGYWAAQPGGFTVSDLVRVSLSLERGLLDKLEALRESAGYANRSEFVRDLIREKLVEDEWAANQEAVGAVTLVYDHAVRNLSDRLTEVQHHHHGNVLVTTHVHLDENLCCEVVLLRGRAEAIRHVADTLRKQKGVLHAALSLSSTGVQLR